MFHRIRWMFRLLVNGNVALKDKIPIVLMMLYILSPIDLIPLPVLGFGILDDIVMFVVLMGFVDRTVKKYYNQSTQDIDPDHIVQNVEYEVKEASNGSETEKKE